jgi:hypothetical protein
LARGSRAHTRGIALGVYGLAQATPPLVALRGLLGQYPCVNDQQVRIALSWPCWSLKGSRDAPLDGRSPTVALVETPL